MNSPFDVCIVGTGAAGLYLADQLARDKQLKIALVEAGPRNLRSSQEPFTVLCAKRFHAGVNTARVTGYGGATNTWGGGLMRLAAADLAPHPDVPHTGWPLSYEELSTNYEKVEQRLRVNLPREYLERRLYETSDSSFRQRLATVLPFWRKNFARTMGEPLLNRPNVSAYFGAGQLVSGIGTRQAIQALQFEHSLRIEANQFVIAAGVVNSILIVRNLLSQANCDGTHRALGRGFHDHISIPLFTIRPRSSYAFSKRFSYHFARTLMFAEHYETEHRAGSIIPSASAFVHFTFDLSASPTLRFIKQSLEVLQHGRKTEQGAKLHDLRDSPTTLAKLITAWAVHRTLYIPDDVPITAVLDLEQLPFSDWCLERVNQQPRLTWDLHQVDIDNARHCALAAADLIGCLSSEAAFSYEALFPNPRTHAEEFRAFVYEHATDTYHGAGGLRMGANPSSSLVSDSLALHPFRNVYVVSTAVFPRVGAANPTLTVLALAQRLADQLAARTPVTRS